MARKILLELDELYHIYNRGVDKRDIILDKFDQDRFYSSLTEFNTIRPAGGIYERSLLRKINPEVFVGDKPLVKIVCFAINPNHFHLLLQQITEKGIEKYVHRLTMGFSKYFNGRYERKGTLFQGSFGSSHIDSNEYLLHLSAYINLNDQIHSKHQPRHRVSSAKLGRTSWTEYLGEQNICDPSIILSQFPSIKEYEDFSLGALENIRENKILAKELENDEIEPLIDTECLGNV